MMMLMKIIIQLPSTQEKNVKLAKAGPVDSLRVALQSFSRLGNQVKEHLMIESYYESNCSIFLDTSDYSKPWRREQ